MTETRRKMNRRYNKADDRPLTDSALALMASAKRLPDEPHAGKPTLVARMAAEIIRLRLQLGRAS